ncbi:hypothetical protein MKW98_031296 [Papaver atlanticum]|uniref:Uncharacterized protein n=1 Tax=Papaver atlanticum TaxID=357466 RepID=A0AAD4S4Z5_9MAGN|nr:hypothetical protein MKW98_031296 [Papaver atlanticum]
MVEDSPVCEIENDSADDNYDDEEEEVVKALEVEVKQMAKSILEYRQTLPDQLKKSLATLLVAQRPSSVEPVEEDFPSPLTSQTLVPGILGPAGSANQNGAESLESGKVALLAEDDPETARKILQLKAKVSCNVAALPIVLKRVNDCISKIEILVRMMLTFFLVLKGKRM